MSAYGARALWFPPAVPAPARLTRRGRLARSVAVMALLVLAAVVATDALTGQPALADTGRATPVVTRTVVVERGDSLWAIARVIAPQADPREVVVTIRDLNGMRSNRIHPGQVLLVPSVR